MIDVTLHCAMCGKTKEVEVNCLCTTMAAEIVDKAGWVWQQNGENFDIYCSKKCAE